MWKNYVFLIQTCWAVDVTFGSTVKLAAESKWFLHSLEVQWSGGPSGENIVTLIEDPANPQVYWSVYGSGDSGAPIACGTGVVFRHGTSGKSLKVSEAKSRISPRDLSVVTQNGDTPIDGDVFAVECESTTWQMGTKISLKHVASGQYLKASEMYTQHNCPRCPIVGQKEVSVGGKRSEWAVEGGVILTHSHLEKEEEAEEIRDEL